MADSDKDTIYVDIDDEITGIIDKLKGSRAKVVALVLPKRAAVFQSIVNMKLLKRASEDAKKHLVLITTEAGLLPLAGAAGVHVAKTLNSKPEIPVGPMVDEEAEESIDELSGEPTDDAPLDTSQSVGDLAAPTADEVETIELDNDESPLDDDTPLKKDFTPPNAKKDKKLKIPNFNRFRKLLIIGGLVLVGLIAGLIFAAIVLPKATIEVKTDASAFDTELNLNLSTTAKSLDKETKTVPAKLVQQQKTYSQQVATTGQKNHGNKASGSISITNCSDDATLPAGTGFSSGGNTYISQSSVTIPASNFNSHGQCKNDGKASVNVLAQSGGTAFNLPSGASFSIAGGSSGLSAQGGTMSGGTDSIVQTVNQGDINSAKAKINTSDPTVKQALQDQLKQDNYFPIGATFSAGTPSVTTSANVGDAASSVTVTEVVTYSMFGVRESDLKALIDDSVKSQIDTSKQKILSDGLDTATFAVNNSTATGAQLTLQTTATAGPDLDINAIKRDAAGKKPSAVKTQLTNNPDVTDVNVKLSPFWVSNVPTKTSKIKVVIAKPVSKATPAHDDNQ